LLNNWYEQRDELEWVIATIIGTEGSSYRKPGAMMMINSLGQYHGLISGGCLESDIMRQSRQCWMSGKNIIIQYDMREEEDITWQLGIGCGGLVRILLQPVSADNAYLKLIELRE
jgi:xanthine dehydrogenase accessory factor